MALGLTLGAVLARTRRFRIHGWLQGSIAVLNAVIVATVMIPALHRHLAPGGGTSRLVTVHAVAGSVAELLALYIVLSTGLGWIPARIRILNYKPWMRSALAAWMVAAGLGFWTYRALNGGEGSGAGVSPAAAPGTRIMVKNFGFEPAELTIAPGTEVEWLDQGGRHTVQADDGTFKSEIMTAGASYRHRFNRPGRYRYFCEIPRCRGRPRYGGHYHRAIA